MKSVSESSLARQTGSACAERQADREIALPRGRARQKQTREVGAADHQQHADDRQHRLHRLAVPIAEFGKAG